MTEREWLTAMCPREMLDFICPRLSDRKLRLFAVACCLCVGPALPSAEWRQAVEAAFQFAQGQASLEQMLDARAALEVTGDDLAGGPLYAQQMAPWFACAPLARHAVSASGAAANFHPEQEPLQAGLLRCVAGNPFHTARIDPRWRTPDVLHLALAAQEQGAFEGLPILADALEEAGCTGPAILEHLRGPGPHTCGCWVLDLVLADYR